MEVACLHGASIRWALCSLFTVAHLRYLHVNSLRVAVCLVVYVYACMHVCIVEACMFINVVTCGGCSGPSGEPMIWPASSCFIDSERTSQAYQRVLLDAIVSTCSIAGTKRTVSWVMNAERRVPRQREDNGSQSKFTCFRHDEGVGGQYCFLALWQRQQAQSGAANRT